MEFFNMQNVQSSLVLPRMLEQGVAIFIKIFLLKIDFQNYLPIKNIKNILFQSAINLILLTCTPHPQHYSSRFREALHNK
jgi:hypothetical protein